MLKLELYVHLSPIRIFPQDRRAINLFCEKERHSHYDNVGFTADMMIATGKLCWANLSFI